jgi:hypothetical protein
MSAAGRPATMNRKASVISTKINSEVFSHQLAKPPLKVVENLSRSAVALSNGSMEVN